MRRRNFQNLDELRKHYLKLKSEETPKKLLSGLAVDCLYIALITVVAVGSETSTGLPLIAALAVILVGERLAGHFRTVEQRMKNGNVTPWSMIGLASILLALGMSSPGPIAIGFWLFGLFFTAGAAILWVGRGECRKQYFELRAGEDKLSRELR